MGVTLNNVWLEAMFLIARFAFIVQLAQILFLKDDLHPICICRGKITKLFWMFTCFANIILFRCF